ncbi:DUF2231 domain-containing protein [Actinopolymorpha alba]|uniref:DUF2231 domain-containing protein n=1 Tax=Actinopolymorpha alba TaxID=533267 RepID=UPI000372113E|nr:DUF2231 domain-containing protein [Actinopolymorpha alba]
MPTFISGLPLHALIVHAVVVLVPLAALGSVVISLWPAARRRYGWLVVAVTAVAVGSVPLATETGEGLRDRLEPSEAIARHADLGGELLIFVAPLLVAVAVLNALDLYQHRRSRAEGPGAMTASRARPRVAGWVRPLTVLLAATAVLLSVGTTIQVVRIGDAGARAVWGDEEYVKPAPHGG